MKKPQNNYISSQLHSCISKFKNKSWVAKQLGNSGMCGSVWVNYNYCSLTSDLWSSECKCSYIVYYKDFTG
jgi:hypothetical protein